MAAILAILGFLPVTYWLMDGAQNVGAGRRAGEWMDYFWCAVIGIGVTMALVAITEYFTGTLWPPVKKIAAASETGHATNIIAGLAVGLKATALPDRSSSPAPSPARYELGGYYGIGVAVMAMLSLTGVVVALDAFGPITDNAGGIAEMAELPEGVRGDHRPARRGRQHHQGRHQGLRHRLRRPRRRGAVRLLRGGAEQRRSASRQRRRRQLQPGQPVRRSIGLFIGGMMPFLFAAFSMEAVGRAGGQVVEEVRRQFREKPGIMEGTERPDYARCVRIVTASAQREMLLPAAIPILFPIITAFIFGVNNGREMLGGLLLGVIVTGIFVAISMTSGGGAWDNAKKLIEDGHYGGKGSEAHKAAITGDTVGDPYKDTAGPAINPMIKVANIVALLIIPFLD